MHREESDQVAAGGIGGLLAVCDPNDPCDPADTAGDFVYTYDANGNVGQLIDPTPTSWDAGTVMVARYEYDPYGKVTQSAGSYAAANPFRFSTKWFDAETGFGYWGERYYWPELGRWLNRDPIEEAGGVNLYGYVGNGPVNAADALGHVKIPWGKLLKAGGFIALLRCGACIAAIDIHIATCDLYACNDEAWANCVCQQLAESKATKWLCRSCAFLVGDPVEWARDYVGCQ